MNINKEFGITKFIAKAENGLGVTFTPEARAMLGQALWLAGRIVKVTRPNEQEEAVKAQIALKEVISQTEKARKELKAPVLAYGKAIDTAAEVFVTEAEREFLRVSKAIGDYDALEQMKARSAEQARNDRLTELEREKAKALVEADTHESADEIVERFNRMAENLPIVQQPARAEGQRIQEDWNVTVIDIWALARAHPGAVKIEPLVGQIKAMLNSGVKVAGVKAEKIIKADVRVKKGAMIEV